VKFPSFFITYLLLWTHAWAGPTVAIVDSGVDFRHHLLASQQFFNPRETIDARDRDLNGYVDDISGWNFVTMDNRTFVASDFPFFEEDFYRYYEIRRKRTLKISTEAEDLWYQEKRKDDEFQEKRRLFRRYIHGTHVAGLAVGRGLEEIIQSGLPTIFERPKVMAITYLGDTQNGPAAEPIFEPLLKGSQKAKIKYLRRFVTDYLGWQKNKFNLAASYAAQFAHVLNASFGISYESAGTMVETWWQRQFPQSSQSPIPSDKLLKDLQKEFRAGLLQITKEVVDQYPGLLFVFSAGNGNDPTMTETHYPSGVSCSHCVTVGASFGTKERAYFSNYGQTSVSLFAPGVAVPSSVPEDRELAVNGTSQAAPQVAFAGANIFNLAWKEGLWINAAMVKDILLASVDLKENLKDQCESGGILNPLRALYLTKKLKNYSFKHAKIMAYNSIENLNFMPEGTPQDLSLLKSFAPQAIEQEVDPLFP
jgi:hypothetical protein